MHNISIYLSLRQKHKLNLFFCMVRRKSHSIENVFPERFLQIRTCGELYRKWRDQKLYSNLPDDDVTFEVPFIDTRPNEVDNANSVHPTVLALHGVPGSWRDYIHFTSYLHNQGCRVIAPSFPDFHTYKPGIFRHSDEEKAQYIKDFLSAISVSDVDLLASHSASVYPALNLCLDQKPRIKSLALLNPATFNIKMSSTSPIVLLEIFVKASENPISLGILKIVGPFFLKNIYKTPIRFESVLDPLLSATAMLRGNIKGSKEKFKKLVSQKLPIFYVFSEEDPLISTKPSYELAELLGACVSDIFIYNKKGLLEQEGISKPTLKVLAFQQGSHYAFLKYPELINGEIVNFLKTQKIL